MPYHIIKSSSGYKVENKNTKKKYSKKPMTKANATKQKKILDNSQMKEHAKHHSIKHINLMKKLIKEGKSFNQAHKLAKKKD